MQKQIGKELIKKLIKINHKLIEYYGIPKRQSPLPNPLDTLIATILSQNTNDNNSYKAFNNLKTAFTNWDEVANASKFKIEKLIKVAGLAKAKTQAIKSLLTELKKNKKYDLNFLREYDNNYIIKYLSKIKGIGVKTASCVLLFSFDRNICPVDTHLHRILNRLGIVNTNSPQKTFIELNENFPDGIAHSFHTNLILLGREICTPKNPKCKSCPLNKICKFENKNEIELKLNKNKRILLLDNIGI